MSMSDVEKFAFKRLMNRFDVSGDDTAITGVLKPAEDNAVYLGDETHRFKGVHFPYDLITEYSGDLSVRNNANTSYQPFRGSILKCETGFQARNDNVFLEAKDADGCKLYLKARDTGVGSAIVGVLQGAADPFMAITGILTTAPTNANLPDGFWTIGYAAGGNATLYVNHGGTIKTLVLGAPA